MTVIQQPTGASPSSSSVELISIPSRDAWVVEDLFRPLIAPALLRTRKIDVASLFKLAHKGRFQLWIAWDTQERDALAALVTEICDYPTRRVARALLLAGRQANRWRHLVTTLESWARGEGCAALEMVGRPGWGRLFPDYAEIERVFSKEL